jgi:hypothetical protein
VWRLPAYTIAHNILTNLIYAGACAFGRGTSRISVVDGRKPGEGSDRCPTSPHGPNSADSGDAPSWRPTVGYIGRDASIMRRRPVTRSSPHNADALDHM